MSTSAPSRATVGSVPPIAPEPCTTGQRVSCTTSPTTRCSAGTCGKTARRTACGPTCSPTCGTASRRRHPTAWSCRRRCDAVDLLTAFEHAGDDRAGFGRLPRLVRLTPRLRPFDVDVDPSARLRGTGEDGDSRLEHSALHRAVSRPAERMAERELDAY